MGTARMKHPITGDIYTDEDGDVRVERGDKNGLFRRDGSWISGELREADPMMCIWMAGHNFGDSVPFRNQRLQKDHGAGRRKTEAGEESQ